MSKEDKENQLLPASEPSYLPAWWAAGKPYATKEEASKHLLKHFADELKSEIKEDVSGEYTEDSVETFFDVLDWILSNPNSSLKNVINLIKLQEELNK